MTEILLVYHSQGGITRGLAQHAARAARRVEGVRVALRPARRARLDDLLRARGVLFCTPEYFGYMAGAVKDFLDRTHEPARRELSTAGKAYGVVVVAGNDGAGALASVQRIAGGYPLRERVRPVIVRGAPTAADRAAVAEAAMTLAAGCQAGVF